MVGYTQVDNTPSYEGSNPSYSPASPSSKGRTSALQADNAPFDTGRGHFFGGLTMKLRFPLRGIYLGGATLSQPEGTTFSCLNVRAYDPLDKRARGGQRPGLDKWGAGTQIGTAEQPVVAMCVVQTIR